VGDRDKERPKKSWREIDSQRDRARSGGAPQPGGPGHGPSAERSSKQYRAALDALFEKGELGKLAEKLAAPQGRSAPAVAPPPPSTPAPAPAPAPAAAPPAPKEDPRATLRKKVLEAIGRDEISRAVDRYVKAHGMPEDFEVLEQALEHHKPDRIREALQALDGLLGRDKPKRSRTLAGKLRFIEETSGDDELRQIAAAVRGRL
jgi:hypothetical protein